MEEELKRFMIFKQVDHKLTLELVYRPDGTWYYHIIGFCDDGETLMANFKTDDKDIAFKDYFDWMNVVGECRLFDLEIELGADFGALPTHV